MLSGWRASGIHSLYIPITGVTSEPPQFKLMGSGDWTLVLMPARQALYRVSSHHTSTLSSLILKLFFPQWNIVFQRFEMCSILCSFASISLFQIYWSYLPNCLNHPMCKNFLVYFYFFFWCVCVSVCVCMLCACNVWMPKRTSDVLELL